MLQRFETLKSVNIDVDVPLWHFLRWENMALGLSECLCGEKNSRSQNELSIIANYRGHIPSGFVEVC